MEEAEQECLRAGCDGFLSKPVNFDKLLTMLAKIAGIEVTTTTFRSAENTQNETSAALGHPDTYNDGPIESTLPMHKERFRKIVAQFVEGLDARFDAIEKVLLDGDAHQLIEMGHSLKGASGNCGLPVMAECALQLEQQGRDGDLDSIQATLDELREIRSRIVVPDVTLVT